MEIDPAAPWADDLLNRQAQGEALLRLLKSTDGPLVIALKGAYGAGKSTFLRRLSSYLELNRLPVVSLDAWRSDYLQDPLLSFVAALKDRLLRQQQSTKAGAAKQKIGRIISAVAKNGGKLAGPVAGALAKTLVPGSSEIISGFAKALTSSSELLLAEQEKHEATVSAFRQQLERARDVLNNRTKDQRVVPIVFLIDELDRCRPSFAISALERVKHFFDVEGVIFVIATDGSNLPAAVKFVYGEHQDGELYLRKFFDYECWLRQPTAKEFSRYLAEQFSLSDLCDESATERVIHFFAAVADALELTLRDQTQAFAMISATLRSKPRGFPVLEPIVVVCVGLRFAMPRHYEALRKGQAMLKVLLSDAIPPGEDQRLQRIRNAISSEGLKEYFAIALHALALRPDVRREYFDELVRARPDGSSPSPKQLSSVAELKSRLPTAFDVGGHGYVSDLLSLADSFGPSAP